MGSIAQLLENRQKVIEEAMVNKKPPWDQTRIEKEIISQIEKLISKVPFRGRIHIKTKGMISGEIKTLKIISKSKPNAKLFFEIRNGKDRRKTILIFQDLIDIFSWEI